MMGEHAAGTLQRGADDLRDVDQIQLQIDSAGFEPSHVEQVCDKAVEPFGLVLQRGEQLIAIAGIIFVRVDAQARYSPDD